MTSTNPAARLLDILTRMADVQGGSCRRAWAVGLGVKENDATAISKGVADIYAVIEEIKNSICAIPEIDVELYMASFPSIERILDLANIGHSWEPHRNELSQPHVLQGLRFCSAALKTHSPEPVLDAKTLDDLANDVSSAIASISKDTSIPPSLRALLIQHLHAIQAAVAAYRIYGAASLRQSLELAIGGLIAHRSLLQGQEKSPGFERFVAIVRKGAGILETAQVFTKAGFSLISAIQDGTKLLR
ncbi:MAG: hypothetical protein IPM33_03690 [Phycisphaerales bacterium]|nr:hypothetical protein [Phycisphaerales bacterium]